MFVRIRWFLLGVVTTLGAGAYVITQIRRARERLTPRNVARTGAHGVAAWLDAAADRIAPPSSSSAPVDHS